MYQSIFKTGLHELIKISDLINSRDFVFLDQKVVNLTLD